MYIGPWQEYNLSKSRYGGPCTSSKGDTQHDTLRRELLKALEESLDPDVAAKAIQAVNKTLEQPTPSAKPHISLPKLGPNGRDVRSYRRAVGNRSRRSHLPRISSVNYDSERESLPSTRSTMSEPIQGTKMLCTPDSGPPSHRERVHVTHRRGDYDAMGMLDVLRLQKAAEKRKPRPDFSGLWKWNHDQHVSGKSDKAQPDKIQHADQKMDRVKRMQELYTIQNKEQQHGKQSDNENSTETAWIEGGSPQGRIHLSPIRGRTTLSPHYKPRTPVVNHKDLTDDDYAAVSKYFTRMGSPLKPMCRQDVHEDACSPTKPPSLHISKGETETETTASPIQVRVSSPRVRNPSTNMEDNVQLDHAQFCGASRELSLDMESDNDMSDTENASDMRDTYGKISSPGLLDWTSTLNIDSIDSMY
mmetsp:Transcript_16841/g.25324  ORF Transcript_16841/g.25324 Transcript_16841/m.25324 type:complete len:417 (+) Transcript_16841:62-1312(+)